MKVKINGIKFKFKKGFATDVLQWLSAVVHTLAALNQNAEASGACDLAPEFEIPPCFEEVSDESQDYEAICFAVDDLADLKAARRKVAAAVRLERMP